MKKIQMVDLKSQYQKIKPEIDVAIQEVIDSTAFIKGSAVKNFEKEFADYLGVKHVIACGNGTDALQIALMALGLERGDEVITTSFTFIATAEVIALLGLTPVLVDVEMDTYNISVEAVEKAITSKTKAIIPVHLFGQAANMDDLVVLAKKHQLSLIEDTAQGIGGDYYSNSGQTIKLGTMGDIGTTSFFPSKNLGCYGDGGALFTNNDEIAHKIRIIANHGMETRYYHDLVGVNSRLDSIQAAILRVKLPHLDEYSNARRKAAHYYDQAFLNHPNIKIPYRSKKSKHIFHQYTLLIKDANRDELREYLGIKNIPAMIYYPVPLHLQKAYLNERYVDGDFPVTEYLASNVLSLPMHTELTDIELSYIKEAILAFFK